MIEYFDDSLWLDRVGYDVSVYDENFDGSFYVWERWLRPGGAGKLLIGRSILAGQNGNKNQQAANYDINSYLYAFDLSINEELCFN